jgi:hypothetical protein
MLAIKIPTWIPPYIECIDEPDRFSVLVGLTDADLLMFVADGYLDIVPTAPLSTVRVEPANLREGISQRLALSQRETSDAGMNRFYCHGVFSLEDGQHCSVLFGFDEPSEPIAGISDDAIGYAANQVRLHRARAANRAAQEALCEIAIQSDKSDAPKDANPTKAIASQFSSEQPTQVDLDQGLLPVASMLAPCLPIFRETGVKDVEQAALSALGTHLASNSLARAPLNGLYVCYVNAGGYALLGVLTWQPSYASPNLLEARHALDKVIPKALEAPLRESFDEEC